MEASSKTKGGLFLIAGRLLSLATQFLAVGFFTQRLGLDGWGLCAYVSAITTISVLVDVGFGEGGWIYLSRGEVKGKSAGIWEIWGTFIRLAFLHSFLGMLLVWVLGFFLDRDRSVFSQQLFLFGGIYAALQLIVIAIGQFLASNRSFKTLATMNMTASTLGNIVALVLIARDPKPPYYMIGLIIGAGTAIVYGIYHIRKSRSGSEKHGFNRDLARDFVVLGRRNYVSRLFQMAALHGDTVLLGQAFSKEMVTHYSNSKRLPDGFSDLIGQLRQAVQSDLAKDHVAGDGQFASSVDRYSRIALGLSVCFLLVPSSFGAVILPLWFHDKAYEGGALVMFGMALYRTFEQCFSTYGGAMSVALKPQYLIAPILWNGIATLCFTIPMAKWLGVEGLALMNVSIDVLQWLPLVWLMSKLIAPGLEIGSHLRQAASILAVGLGVSLCSFFLMTTEFFQTHKLVGLGMVPLMSFITGAIVFGFGLAPTPEAIVQRLRRIHPKLVSKMR